jgi:hypothetical protein
MGAVDTTNTKTEALSAPKALIFDTWPADKRRFLVSPSASQPGADAALPRQLKIRCGHIRREK